MSEVYTCNIMPRAELDMEEIAEYIFQSSPQNARLVKQRLATAIESLAFFPGRFKVYEQNADPAEVVHSMPVTPFTVFYRIVESTKTVEVLSVRRGTRDRPPRFFR